MIGNPLVRWLLGLDAVPADAHPVRLAWEHPLAAWAWTSIAAAAVAIAWMSYRRMPVGAVRGRTLVALRSGVLVLLAALAAGPLLEVPRESVEPDVVLVLADRSASMEVQDIAGAGGSMRSRDAALRAAIGAGNALASLGKEHQVAWFGFSESIDPLVPAQDGSIDPGDAAGDRTLLGSAITEALSRASGRPVSAVVLLTDGRTTDPPDRSLVRRLQADGIAVLSMALGSEQPLGDALVTESRAPRRAFARDLVPVEAVVERRGPAAARGARVVLVDTATGTVLDRSELAPSPDDAVRRDVVQLVARPSSAGDARWEVRIEPGEGTPDLMPANDRRAIPVTLVDRPVRVLYVEGYPRWEYRYLKNLLQREQTVESAVMLLSADRDFAQEGNTPIGRLPRTREEFARYDLIVIGDVPASFFTGDQLMQVRSAVAERGTGLAWIGGSRSTPRSWHGTSLEDLLPFGGPYELERIADPVNLEPTAAAARLGVLRIADDPKEPFPAELRDSASQWAMLEWAQRISPSALKPTAEVLAESVQQVEGSPAPLVVTMRYGAGTVLYVATDEIWRWRNGRGETYPERFWVQLLRSLARPSLGVGREEVSVAVEPGRAFVGDAVRVEVELPSGQVPPTVALEAVPEDARSAAVDIEARPGSGSTLVASWVPESPGRWRIRPRDPSLAAKAGSGAVVEVGRSDRELRDAESDWPLLRALARETGGTVEGPDGLDALVRAIPNRSIRTERPIRDELWNSPAALMAMVLLLTAEWVVRRSARLI